MLLGEPPRTQFDLNFSLFGIPVRVHPLFWLVTLLLGGNPGDAGAVLTWIVAVFIGILVHELGHAFAMRMYAFRPWIVLYGLGGETAYDLRAGYHTSGTGTLAQVLISFAGPLAGFLLAALLVVGLAAAGYREVVVLTRHLDVALVVALPSPRLADFCDMLFRISVWWGIINLLPVYPLDGGQIAREILLKLSPGSGIRMSLILSMSVAVVLAVVGIALWQSWYIALLFGYLAYMSYATLQAYSDRRPW